MKRSNTILTIILALTGFCGGTLVGLNLSEFFIYQSANNLIGAISFGIIAVVLIILLMILLKKK